MEAQLLQNALTGQIQTGLKTFLPEDRLLTRQDNMILQAINTQEPDFAQSLRQYVGMVVVSAGIKSAPDELTFLACVAFWQQFYQKYKAAELLCAFQLNMADELGPRIEHYQSMDVVYISALMNAYKKLRGAAVVKTYTEERLEYTPAQKKQLHIDSWLWILKQFFVYKEKKQFTIGMVDYWFQQMEQHGFIAMSRPDKDALHARVLKILEARVAKGIEAFKDMKEYRAHRETLAGRNQPAIVLACREMAIKEYWEEVPDFVFEEKVKQIIKNIETAE